jgi:hypothetical protein
MRVDAQFPVPAAVVEMVQPVKSGSEVNVKTVIGDKIRVTYGLGEALVNISDTDFAQRLKVYEEAAAEQERQQRIRAAQEATEERSAPKDNPFSDSALQLAGEQFENILRIDTARFTAFYEANELNAERELKGKMIVLTGKVSSVDKSIWGVPYVAMDGAGMWRVQCFFPKEDAGRLAALTKGQTIAVRGKVGFKLMMSIALQDCGLVNGQSN